MKKHNTGTFVRVATVTPTLSVGNIKKNTEACISALQEASRNKAQLVLFPELSLTGYTAGDLFHTDTLHRRVEESLFEIEEATKNIDLTFVIGAPIQTPRGVINGAVVYSKGIRGIVPKMHLPNYKEFYEKRWFISGFETPEKTLVINGREIAYGSHLLFVDEKNTDIKLGIEICEDGWMPVPPSTLHALEGATLLANLSASNELVGKAAYRKQLTTMQSAKTVSAYIYASSGVHESTTDVVFSGHSLITENGYLINESKRFSRDTEITYGDIDIDHLITDRNRTNSITDNRRLTTAVTYTHIPVSLSSLDGSPTYRHISQTPFFPSEESKRAAITEDIFNIQVAGLAKRLESTGISRVVLGLSGGLDSTLAFLVCLKTFKLLGLPTENIHAITMPGFGTTSGTKNNALLLAEATHVSIEEISITEAVLQHFKDIGHDASIEDVVFENSQARYRTMLLMDKANKLGAIVVGTGDLSESALGWCTFNGDHISHYNVNGSIPKTLVRYVTEHVAHTSDETLKKILMDILDTPISPELTRADNDAVVQKTEDLVGPYILHDFFLYHFIRWGSSTEKILMLATLAFKDAYDEATISKWLTVFIKRFFNNQWKRSVMPDGPKVGSVSLSPRGDWRMPSDADMYEWVKEI